MSCGVWLSLTALLGLFSHGENPPEGKLVFLLEVSRKRVRVRVVNDGGRGEFHFQRRADMR